MTTKQPEPTIEELCKPLSAKVGRTRTNATGGQVNSNYGAGPMLNRVLKAMNSKKGKADE